MNVSQEQLHYEQQHARETLHTRLQGMMLHLENLRDGVIPFGPDDPPTVDKLEAAIRRRRAALNHMEGTWFNDN